MPGAGGPDEVDEVLDLTDGFSEGSFTRNPMRRAEDEEEKKKQRMGEDQGAGDGKVGRHWKACGPSNGQTTGSMPPPAPALKVSFRLLLAPLSIPRCTTSRRGRSKNFLYSLGLVAFIVVVLAGWHFSCRRFAASNSAVSWNDVNSLRRDRPGWLMEFKSVRWLLLP